MLSELTALAGVLFSRRLRTPKAFLEKLRVIVTRHLIEMLPTAIKVSSRLRRLRIL